MRLYSKLKLQLKMVPTFPRYCKAGAHTLQHYATTKRLVQLTFNALAHFEVTIAGPELVGIDESNTVKLL